MPEVRTPRWIRRPEERPQELLDAALAVFAAHGYRATRLEQVADAAGVTKGAIYHYFSTKEELLKQALQTRIGAIFSGIAAEGREAGATPTARLRAVLAAAWRRWRQPESARMNRLVMGELRSELPELFDAAMRAGPMHIWNLVAEILAEGQRAGEFGRHVEPGGAARFVVSGLMHQALLLTDLHERGLDDVAPEQVFDAAFEVVLSGIVPRPGSRPIAKRAATRPADRRRRS